LSFSPLFSFASSQFIHFQHRVFFYFLLLFHLHTTRFADRAHPSASNDALDTTTTDKDVQQAQNARVKLLFRRGSAR